MVKSLAKEASRLTIRAKIAIAIGIAERVVPCLKEDSEGFIVASSAMKDCWRWGKGFDVTSSFLYRTYADSLRDHEVRLKSVSPVLLAAIVAVEAALYYTIWQAHGIEWKNGLREELPEDVYEVSDKMLDFALDRARQTNRLDDSWLERVVNFLQRNHASADGDESPGRNIKREELMFL